MTDYTATKPIGLGHNRPIAETLADNHAELAARVAEFVAAGERLPTECGIDDTATLEKLAAFVRHARALDKVVDTVRTGEKSLFDAASKDVQAFFSPQQTQIDAAKRRAEGVINTRNRQAEQRERDEAMERARLQREEADRQAEMARQMEDKGKAHVAETMVENASKADQMATSMEKKAAGSTADLVRTQTGGGTVSSKAVWVFSVTDQQALRSTLGKLADHFTIADIEKAIRAFVAAEKKAGRAPELAGVLFTTDTRATVR